MARVFISYKRREPDSMVARELHQALTKAGHEVFIDVTMPVGVRWAEQIETELQRCDFLVALLSEESAQSEMTIGEIGTAWRLKKSLLPVRMAWREPFKYPLSAWLEPINWAFWDGHGDTSQLVEDLVRAIGGEALPIGQGELRREMLQASEPAAFPPPLPMASIKLEGGAMDVESRLYIRRKADEVAARLIVRKGQTLTIKGPPQVGKSSLLTQIHDMATTAGKRVALIDFLEFDAPALASGDAFFRMFCALISERLELQDKVDTSWDSGLGNVQSCSRYMGNCVLKALDAPLVLAMDGVDRLFEAPFRSDFFGMLRAWHGKRAQPTAAAWKKLDLVLVTSTEPYLLIENLQQSPFNVGELIELSDFSPEEFTRLNQLYGPVVNSEDEKRLLALLGGHPYLLERALHCVTTQRMAVLELVTSTDLDGGPFGDHLRHLLFLVNRRKELADGMREILLQGKCRDASILHQLCNAGLVRQEREKAVPRCELYARYFRKHLLG